MDDAFTLLAEAGLEVDRSSASIHEGIGVQDLDENHVVPNMGVIVRRGIWYPNRNASP
ncbi:MAG: hypothetical protein AAGI52_08475 [Bacteroidota bacterium]